MAKVTGTAAYTNDLIPDGALHARVVRSTRAHAAIRGIDLDVAAAVPGVVAVVTAADMGRVRPRFGHIVADHPILALETTRYYGEPVAMVVATTRYEAADAARLVDVHYEDLTPVLTADQALADGAPIIHTAAYERGDPSFARISRVANTNVCHEATLEWGDVDAVFGSDVFVVETRMRYPMLYAYAMEPYTATASFASDGLDITTTAQHPYQVRDELSRLFGLPLSKVRVRVPFIGGGYGSKSYTKVEPLAALGAFVTGATVSVALDVEEAVHTTRADPADVYVRSAFTAAGAILARDFDIVLDTGAFADNGPLVLEKAVRRCLGPYRIPNARAHGRAVYTNTVPSSSYRGFGAPQVSLAGEVNLDQAAVELGVSPVSIRRDNLLRPGEVVIPGLRPLDADLVADLDMLVSKLGADEPGLVDRGAGFGCTASDAGAFPVSSAIVRYQNDDSVILQVGSTEMGQGSRTVLAQIVAHELGVDPGVVEVVQSDTGLAPYERTTGASRTTTLEGLAVVRACDDLGLRIVRMAEEVHGGSTLGVAKGSVMVGATSATFGEVIRAFFGGAHGEAIGQGSTSRRGDLEQMPPFWEIGMTGVEIGVDRETGQITVEHLVTVGDVGFAINPALVEGQDLGAATQGLGAALYEELIYDGAQLVNPNLVEYRVPRMGDMPKAIDNLLAERHDGVGPGGAKGAGEGALNPMGAAVASAFFRATGVWPDELPLTAPRVWELLNTVDEMKEEM